MKKSFNLKKVVSSRGFKKGITNGAANAVGQIIVGGVICLLIEGVKATIKK